MRSSTRNKTIYVIAILSVVIAIAVKWIYRETPVPDPGLYLQGILVSVGMMNFICRDILVEHLVRRTPYESGSIRERLAEFNVVMGAIAGGACLNIPIDGTLKAHLVVFGGSAIWFSWAVLNIKLTSARKSKVM